MARGRRQPAHKADEPSASTSSNSPSPQVDPIHEDRGTNGSEDVCPSCPTHRESSPGCGKESWIRCDACRTWYHWRCAGNGEDVEMIDKWYCQPCININPSRKITVRGPARKSSRKRTQRDYASLHNGLGSDPNRWLRMLEGKPVQPDPFKRMDGDCVGLSWVEEDDSALLEPIVVETADGLGMKMPPEDFTVNDVTELVGSETPLEVIDVATQSTSPGWTLGNWAEYFFLEPTKRDKILNVISLEISGTKLAAIISPPRIVRELDWVENYWPDGKKGKGHSYPKVQLYCLMGVSTAWTDWHIDFAGSSVYYHILHGSKVFYFIRPTPSNLAAYERWSGSELQNHTWLGDMVDEVYKVELKQGNTMIIPTGWIHAVYTPVDTLVFGGNFLHSYNVATQLRVRNIEIVTQVPRKFRFPYFTKLCWYVADRYLRDFKSQSGAPTNARLVSSILALANFLISEVHTIEQGNEQTRKEAKDQIPSDRVKDAPALARELRWRARHANGYASDDEGHRFGYSYTKDNSGEHLVTNGVKRKRISESPALEEHDNRFKHFRPKKWDTMSEKEDLATRQCRAPRPEGQKSWGDYWLTYDGEIDEEGEEVDVKVRRQTVVKVKRTVRGLERHKIERIVEEWHWENKLDGSSTSSDKT
ncbi:JmjC domain-containing histone demethylation protein 1 [Cyathus striatus]|nr:JmjC domain-containing histone demethylation protein 1 [Cyathus striatus]